MTEFLSAEDEAALVRQMRDGSVEAMQKLVLAHKPLVAKLARRYSRRGAMRADLMSEGYVGLLVAAPRFDPARGVRFATYAHWWVRYRMQAYMHSCASVVGVASSREARLLRCILPRRIHELEHREGRTLAPSELAEMLGVSLDALLHVKGESSRFDTPIGTGEREVDPAAQDDVETLVAEREISENGRRQLESLLSKLSPRERLVIERRFSDDAPMLREIAPEIGVTSRERVRQIEQRALAKLRAAAAQQHV